jgi:hypothetical protein
MNMSEQTFRGFTLEGLQDAWSLIHDPNDWRGPISVWVPGEAIEITVAAIQYYTATNPTVQLNMERMRYLVTSDGYRMGPAGP